MLHLLQLISEYCTNDRTFASIISTCKSLQSDKSWKNRAFIIYKFDLDQILSSNDSFITKYEWLVRSLSIDTCKLDNVDNNVYYWNWRISHKGKDFNKRVVKKLDKGHTTYLVYLPRTKVILNSTVEEFVSKKRKRC